VGEGAANTQSLHSDSRLRTFRGPEDIVVCREFGQLGQLVGPPLPDECYFEGSDIAMRERRVTVNYQSGHSEKVQVT